jgi:hypothetical protein
MYACGDAIPVSNKAKHSVQASGHTMTPLLLHFAELPIAATSNSARKTSQHHARSLGSVDAARAGCCRYGISASAQPPAVAHRK